MRLWPLGFVAVAMFGCGARNKVVATAAVPAASSCVASPPARLPTAPCPYLPSADAVAESEKGPYEVRGDSELPTCEVPGSSFIVRVLDADENPVAGVPLAVGQFDESDGAITPLATGVADAEGTARFTVTPGDRYTVMARYLGGRFAAQFMVPSGHGVDVRLHVVPTTKDMSATKVAIQTNILVERKGAWLEFHEEFRVYNFGTNALLADETVALPQGIEAFHAEGFPEQIHTELTPEGSVRILDTIAPREHEAQFSWRVRAPHDADRTFDLELPLRTAQVALLYVTDDPDALVVADAPPPVTRTSTRGEKSLLATRTFENDGKRHSVRFTVRKIK